MKVLIAEDTESVRFALRMAVEYLGHEVVATASDGEEALQQYDRLRPEVVLMDVRMPRMDGLTCASRLARHDPPAKVVIITGGRTTAQEAAGAGARAFVEKPFGLEELGRAIRSLDERR
jgi:two-component system chemotaxis response regulator CheY